MRTTWFGSLIALACAALLPAATAWSAAPQLKSGMKVKFEHVMNIGSKGAADGQFQYVEDFAWDRQGRLLATDAVNSNVQVFDAETGKFIAKFAGKGTGKEHMEKPEGIAVAPNGNIYVADYQTGFIKIFGPDYKHIKTFSDYGREPGLNAESEFMDIAHGLLYMAEAGNSRVDVFDLDGNFKFMFGGEGTGPGQMMRPEASKVDSNGLVWVVDLGNNRVQKYDKAGKFIAQWGKEGPGAGEYRKPTGLAIDPHDNIYVAEVHNNRVQVFDNNMKFITMFGTGGAGNGQFGNLHGLIVDKRGYVYVADSANNRIQVFRPVIGG